MRSNLTQEGRALLSLRGLSIGDAFGQRYFVNPQFAEELIARRTVFAGPWSFTDDTVMALSVFEILRRFGEINQAELASSFAWHYEMNRGYGPAMHSVLQRIAAGEPWQTVAGEQFEGMGSYGNGSAMRSAPLGAYFADDFASVIREAERAAVVTHTHPEAIAGAIAVAMATAVAVNEPNLRWQEFLRRVSQHVPDSEVRSGMLRACDLREETRPQHAAAMLGNGSRVTCQDTVPFALWCAARYLYDYAEALWVTVSGLGDRDTTCAIVGGIVACSAPRETIPQAWIDATETLPMWAICDIV